MKVILLKIKLKEKENIKENGEYYIGDWENGLMHGKGTLF